MSKQVQALRQVESGDTVDTTQFQEVSISEERDPPSKNARLGYDATADEYVIRIPAQGVARKWLTKKGKHGHTIGYVGRYGRPIPIPVRGVDLRVLVELSKMDE